MKRNFFLGILILWLGCSMVFAEQEPPITTYLPPPFLSAEISKSKVEVFMKVWEDTLSEIRKEGRFKILNINVDAAKNLPKITTIVNFSKDDPFQIMLIVSGPRNLSRFISLDPETPGFKRIFTKILRSEMTFLTQKTSAPELNVSFVDEFDFSRLDPANYTFPVTTLRPASLVEDPKSGNIYVGANSGVMELTPQMEPKELLGGSIADQGIFGFATQVFRTSSGSIYCSGYQSPEILTFFPGNPIPARSKTDKQNNNVLTILPDGSRITAKTDLKPPRLILTRDSRQTVLTVPLKVNSYLLNPIPGPGDTIYLYDTLGVGLWQYTMEGELKDFISLDFQEIPAVLTSPKIVLGNKILLTTSNMIYLYNLDGSVEWKFNHFGQGDYILDHTGTFIYGISMADTRVRKYCLSDKAIAGTYDGKILDYNKTLEKDPNNLGALKSKAKLYQVSGNEFLYRTLLREILEKDPNDQNLSSEYGKVEITLAKTQAAKMDKLTREKLDLGPETARTSYSRTMELYERILKIDPSDEDTLKNFRGLKAALKKSESRYDTGYVPLSLEKDIDNVFPALYEYYKGKPIGRIVIRNPLSKAVTDIRAELEIPNFTEKTRPSILASLKPGESKEMPINIDLLARVLEIQENIPVNARLTLRWKDGEVEQTMDSQVSLQIFRRTAMTWDQASRLASFVTPNEETVSTFAGRSGVMTQGSGGFSEKILRASRIADTLGIYGIRYTPDPNYPITRVQVEKSVIDTVRFPRTTLYQRSGDCDDTTALLCSLYEAVGINTAIVTTPGHVFMAFDTGEPEENAWVYSGNDREVIKADGKLWIPVETTILGKGFAEAWKVGSELIRTYGKDKDYSFTPIYTARKDFPALPLAADLIRLDPVDFKEVDNLDAQTWTALKDTLYTQVLAGLERQTAGQSGKPLLKSLNRLAALHSRFGQSGKAEEVLKKAIATDSSFSPSYVNLGALLGQLNRPAEALQILLEGYKKVPDSVYINLGLAQTYNQLNKPTEGSKYFEMVKKNAPELANRFALAAGQSTGNQRAGTPGLREYPLWVEP